MNCWPINLTNKCSPACPSATCPHTIWFHCDGYCIQLTVIQIICNNIVEASAYLACWFLSVMNMFLPIKVDNLNFFNRNPYLVVNYWKVLLTRKIMTPRRFIWYPWNVSLKDDQFSNFDSLSFRTELTYTSVNCDIVFILSHHFKKTYHSKRAHEFKF